MSLRHFFSSTALLITFAACNKAVPAGFWKNYRKELLAENISNQGPYGGHRAMHWKANHSGNFNAIDVLGFANKNGWSLVDSAIFTADRVSNWTYWAKAIFPLTHTGFSDTSLNNSVTEYFPRWFYGQVKVYTFRTGWITIKTGTDDSIEENGFVVINNAATELAVYHLWGE